VSGELSQIDPYGRLRLVDLEPRMFELFFSGFLNARPELTVQHHGQTVSRRIASATTYAAGSGRNQKGIDLEAEVEGGEVWVFQCKRVKKWTLGETKEAIEKAREFKANHYFLVVACDFNSDVHDEVHRHGDWTLWNLDKICAEFRLRVPQALQPKCLPFLSEEALKRFIPFSTRALISHEEHFRRFLKSESSFRHDWDLVGHEDTLTRLQAFLQEDGPRVFVLSGKGGDGKSRILLELARRLEQAPAGEFDVRCLNPDRSNDNPEFGLQSEAKRQVILVDDAHRPANVPDWLLGWAGGNGQAKVVLAARPQGQEVLLSRAGRVGLHDKILFHPLRRLTLAESRKLAMQALGDEPKRVVEALLERTKDSPFLTVVAGVLWRGRKIENPGDLSDEEFRRQVFVAFEDENLRLVAESDRPRFQALLRLIAVLGPVTDAAAFVEKAARCLDWNSFDVATALDRLRAAQLIGESPEMLRVVPDLFSDFLVFDLCFGTTVSGMRLMERVVGEFADSGPVMLRNLAEAAWISRSDGRADPKFLGKLLADQYQRFEAASFTDRARSVRQWAQFAVWLPVEALKMGRRAMEWTTAPEPRDPGSELGFEDKPGVHADVLRALPALMAPVAMHHEPHRWAALDLLWELGLSSDWKRFKDHGDHPWGVIAQVMAFEVGKAVSVSISALEWLATKLAKPEGLRVLEDPEPVLRIVLSPCFRRNVHYTETNGKTFTRWESEVSLERTQPVRDRALGILRDVIVRGSWMAALDALSAAEKAFCRIVRFRKVDGGDWDEFRARWRLERLKALDLARLALTHHRQVAVRWWVQREIGNLIQSEEDPEVRFAAERIAKEIPEDLDLRMAGALMRQWRYSLDDTDANWLARVEAIARDSATVYPDPDRFVEYLDGLFQHLARACEYPGCHDLYHALARVAPDLALGVARQIVSRSAPAKVAEAWPRLVVDNPLLDPQERWALFEAAARSGCESVRLGLVEYLGWKFAMDVDAPPDREKLVVETLAGEADVDLAIRLLGMIRRASPSRRAWAWGLFLLLPLEEVARKDPERLIEALDSRPDDPSPPPDDLMRHVLSTLVHAPRLEIVYGSEVWDRFQRFYPMEVYDLVVARIQRESVDHESVGYEAIPSDGVTEFGLPELRQHPRYEAVCEELWQRVLDPNEPCQWLWKQLFHAVVTHGTGEWLVRLRSQIEKCGSEDELRLLVRLIRFSGSLIVFRKPELVLKVLERAENLGGKSLWSRLRLDLYDSAGLVVKTFPFGEMHAETDYVEAAAMKAAQAHAKDPVLGPFYRWIVEQEAAKRRAQRADCEAEATELG
jgi:hypothetical protein